MKADLTDLQLFAMVARHRNFRRAAAEARMSPSRLSERLRDLEEQLGVRLLNRTTRSVSPTEAGAVLLERLSPALIEIGDALDRLDDFADSPSGTLRINAPGAAAQLVLAGRLGAFLERHPRIRLDLVVEDQMVDIVEGGFDAGIRYDESLAKDMIAVPIGPPQRYALVASPALLERHGTPAHPSELVGAPAIVHRFVSGTEIPWEFERGTERIVFRPQGRAWCSDAHVEIALAEAGTGFLITFEQWTRGGVRAGRLVELFADWQSEFTGPRLYYSSRRHVPATLRAFIDFMRWRGQDA